MEMTREQITTAMLENLRPAAVVQTSGIPDPAPKGDNA